MILVHCAACAVPLGLSSGKKCGRCSTRYCGPACQEQHWKEGGHDQLCKKIKKAGGAEQYNANTKYTEAVAVAVKKCADDTAGQTCYICTQALHWKTKEGLVRGCSCRGTAGFVHVSCLAEQAKILCDEAEENNLGLKALNERFNRWHTCSLCEQNYHGIVQCGLGWACWKTYLGRPETHPFRIPAMRQLGNGLYAVGLYEDTLSLQEAEFSTLRRVGAPVQQILDVQGNLASTYQKLGRNEEGLSMRRDVYSGILRLYGEESRETVREANNYGCLLRVLNRLDQAKALLRKTIPAARRVLGESHAITLKMRWNYAEALYMDTGATFDDLRLAVNTLVETAQTARRVLGATHPTAPGIEKSLRGARAALRARQEAASRDVSGIRKAVEAMTMGDA